MNSADYERIKMVIGDIYEENSDFMSCIPLDIFEIARRMGFRIIKASQRISISYQKACEFQNINKDKGVFGFSFYDREREEYVIYVDDINAEENRQRFSIAHEIGHIVLGHIDKDMENEKKAEEEANYFAGYILCPECIGINNDILNEINKDPLKLMNMFGIADDTAMIQYKHICNRNHLHKEHYYEYESIIMKCLEESILAKIKK